MAKKILGLDLGTNSIGWALIEQDIEKREGKILGMGSRIIPMSQDIKDEFGKGNSISQTAERTNFRGIRRLRERHLLRRERLHRILNVLKFLPKHYASEIDFEKHFGQFKEEKEPKLAWKKNNIGKFEFLFQELFNEMLADFKQHQPELQNKKNRKGEDAKIPYDWTIYYLRKKALEKAITKEQLASLILNFNQKRGYYQLRGEEEEENSNKLVEFHSLKVIDVKADIPYVLNLDNGMEYRYETNEDITKWKDSKRYFVVTTYLEKNGTAKKDEKGNDKRSIYFLKDNENAPIKKKKDLLIEKCRLTIVDVKEDTENKKEEVWYSVILENDWIYRRSSKVSLADWKGKVRDFIVTADLEDDKKTIAKDKDGKEQRSFRSPSEDDWTLIKKKTENDLDNHIKEYKAKYGIGGTVGTYIYDTLLQKPNPKIRGKLIRTIERKFYKDELKQILEKQIELQPDLFKDKYNDCVRELYRSNEAHQLLLSKRDFMHLFLEDIIFFQRPLKSQKSLIGNCSLEFRKYKTRDESGKDIEVKEYLKAIPKSNPYYQEFRTWQWLYNLKIYLKDNDNDVTAEFIKDTNDWEKLFEFLMTKKEVNHKDILEHLIAPITKEKNPNAKPKALNDEIKKEIAKYRWNYVFDNSKEKEEDKSKKYPCNETGTQIRTRLEKVVNFSNNFLTREVEQQLWHIIYSVNDKIEFEKALKTFANKYNLDETSFVENFKKFPPFKSEYGSCSEKAIKKLLPLMRLGKYWNWEAIDSKTKERIDKILTGEYDEKIKNRVREKAMHLTEQKHFQGLQLWLAQYIIYDRHSEGSNSSQWNSVADIEKYLNEFKQHSLRNPIVEQVITETLRVVKDIWQSPDYGKNAINFFNEIHIELGREMKNTAEDRAKMTNQITENENTNLRIKAMLIEFANNDYFKNKKDYKDNKNETPIYYKKDSNPVRPYSPSQQDILKIYEEGVLGAFTEQDLKNEKTELKRKGSDGKVKDVTIYDISKTAQPTSAEVQRYKLWLEQKYRSPYTGKTIPLSELFTPAYQIEHIIPQARYFDDSFSNKVICEAAVNSLKDKQLGFEFIKNHPGEKVALGNGTSDTVEIFSVEQYETFVKEHYAKNNSKKTKLLLEEIPDKMIQRQLNDTRYISKYISSVLSNIVRENENDDGVNSKNIIPGNGKITSTLRQDWGLNDVWNELILPRFERMNTLTNSQVFTSKNTNGKIIPTVPLELSKGFQKKRIDHRHHALDALVIACATRDHINLLNNQHAKSENSRYDLQNKLRNKEKWTDKNGKERDRFTEFKKPWENFTVEVGNELEKIVVSFKQNLRVINKATNHYEKIENGKKVEKMQLGKKDGKKENWAIRKPLHKEAVYGKVELQHIKVAKGKILTATRKNIDTSFNKETIKSITDTGIQKILRNYLAYTIKRKKHEIIANEQNEEKDKQKLFDTLIKNSAEFAFTPEGLEYLNKNIAQYNNGKAHQPIYKARIYKETGEQFLLGQTGNKKDKYVTTAQGTNLFFAIYEDDKGKRSFESIPLNIVIERQKQGLNSVPNRNEKGDNLLFYLSPNDLVYVPTTEEQESFNSIDFNNLTKKQRNRIYKFTDGSGKMANFISANIASVLFNMNKDKQKKAFGKELFNIQNEIGIGSQGSKNENAITGEQIKSVCIKLKMDRLGNIKLANQQTYKQPSSEHNNIVKEPDSAYSGAKKITVFNSFEDAENSQLNYWAGLNPNQRFADFYELMNRFYKFTAPDWSSKKIIIDL